MNDVKIAAVSKGTYSYNLALTHKVTDLMDDSMFNQIGLLIDTVKNHTWTKMHDEIRR